MVEVDVAGNLAHRDERQGFDARQFTDQEDRRIQPALVPDRANQRLNLVLVRAIDGEHEATDRHVAFGRNPGAVQGRNDIGAVVKSGQCVQQALHQTRLVAVRCL